MASEGCCENGGPSKDGPLLGCPVLRVGLAMKFMGDYKKIRNDQNGSNQRKCSSRGLVPQKGCSGEL